MDGLAAVEGVAELTELEDSILDELDDGTPAPPPGPVSYSVTYHTKRSITPPAPNTLARRIMRALRHGARNGPQIAAAVFGDKNKRGERDLRHIRNVHSVLPRLARRGLVQRVGDGRWMLIRKGAARDNGR